MSDSPLEEFEAHEHMEHAEHAAHSPDRLVAYVSITISILAVASALVGSLETIADGRALSEKNEAVLAQSRASDQWNLYEAKSLKKNLYTLFADQGGDKADKYRAVAASNEKDQAAIQAEAKTYENQREEKLKVSALAEDQHHKLTIAATLMHMGIAISTVAIIAANRWPWYASLVLGVLGAIVAGIAYL
jgi:hypothetical protein